MESHKNSSSLRREFGTIVELPERCSLRYSVLSRIVSLDCFCRLDPLSQTDDARDEYSCVKSSKAWLRLSKSSTHAAQQSSAP